MALLNINRNVVDLFYRYKMERVTTRQQGNYTNITNLEKICTSISRPTEHILKYLGQKLGCGIRNKHGQYLAGIQSNEVVQDCIFSFIDAYVLCKNCGNPETKFSVSKQRLVQACIACGTSNKLKSDKTVDMIVKGLSKKDTSKRKPIRKIVNVTAQSDDGQSDDDWSLDTSSEAVLARKQAAGNATYLVK